MRYLKLIILFAIVLSFSVVPAASAAPATQYGTCGYWYPVRWGETLYSIGRVTGVGPWAIAQANGLANPNYVQAGSSLWIPCQTPPPPPPPPQCGYWYTVRWGETMNSISYRTGVSAWAIAQANGIYNINRIYAGQALWIPCP
ncbi:MAG TPA: LysM peptidoglycan-binding domain-containing protein [Anaerolineae bacterium]|nr:LysM peptidoglycan-binding domain-containing protein [Anaerolineae bacterium]